MKPCCDEGCTLCSGTVQATYTELPPVDVEAIKRHYIAAMRSRRAGDEPGFLSDLRLIGKELGGR